MMQKELNLDKKKKKEFKEKKGWLHRNNRGRKNRDNSRKILKDRFYLQKDRNKYRNSKRWFKDNYSSPDQDYPPFHNNFVKTIKKRRVLLLTNNMKDQ